MSGQVSALTELLIIVKIKNSKTFIFLNLKFLCFLKTLNFNKISVLAHFNNSKKKVLYVNLIRVNIWIITI